MMSQPFATVRLFFNNAGIEFDLPLENDGTMPSWGEHFRSVESLINLMHTMGRRPLSGDAVSADEAVAFYWLTDLLLRDPEGSKLLNAMRGFIRGQQQADAGLKKAFRTLSIAKDAPPMDSTEKYGTPGRKQRRDRARVNAVLRKIPPDER